MFATIDFGITAPSFLHIAASLLKHVGSVEPALEVAAAEFTFLVFLVAGPLSRLLDLDLVMGELRGSLYPRGCACGQRIYPRRCGLCAARFGYESFILPEAFLAGQTGHHEAHSKFLLGRNPFQTHASGRHVGSEVTFTGDGSASHAPKHGNLSHVGQRIGNRPLKEFF